MSQEDNLDRNRVDNIIRFYLMQDERLLQEINTMAERFTEPVDALAAYLVRSCEAKPQNHLFFDSKTCPCTAGQWDFFMERCREVTLTSVNQITDLRDIEMLERHANVGRWPYNIPRYAKNDKEFLRRGWEKAWAYVWYRDHCLLEEFLNGQKPNILEVGSSDWSWIIAYGLIVGLQHGLIEPPKPENLLKFLVAYKDWYQGPEDADINALCEKGLYLSGEVFSMSEKELQELAVIWGRASKELGRRRKPLQIPTMQNPDSWLEGLMPTIPCMGIDEDIETFLKNENPVVRARLWHHYTHVGTYVVKTTNPDDLFGPKVNKFHLETGCFEAPDFPSYEDGLALISQDRE